MKHCRKKRLAISPLLPLLLILFFTIVVDEVFPRESLSAGGREEAPAGKSSASPAGADEGGRDYNRYYRFPLSVGARYQMLTPFGGLTGNFNIFEVSGFLRVPLPPLPLLQITAGGGMIRFDSLDADDPNRWDHTHFFGTGGLLLSHRFAKEFEVGAEVLGGYSYSLFEHLAPAAGAVGGGNWFVQAGGKLNINPSYNFSIEVNPNVTYLGSLSVLKDFEGFFFGIGFGAHVRFGKDPDSPQRVIRSLTFEKAELPPLFAAMQSYYAKNPVGRLVVSNGEKHPVEEVEISFFQPGFMDSPTPAASFEKIEAGGTKEIGLPVSFNDEVFTLQGVTPLTGEVIITYTSLGRPAEQRKSVTYDLHDKTALTWTDDRKVAAFITPADSALRNYTSFIRQTCKGGLVDALSKPLQEGMQIFEGLNELGVIYQIDPKTPFTEMQEKTGVVDSVSLPRDTLLRITGDCDDLTVLYCSLLETVGISSGFITVPGHIFAAFDTGVSPREYEKVHPDRNMSIAMEGRLWVPVEVTVLGKGSFLEAWRKGVEAYRRFEEEPRERNFYVTREAQQVYRPVGLRETDLGLQYGNPDTIVRLFSEDVGRLAERSLEQYRARAREENNKRLYNKLGIAYAGFKQYGKARASFEKALDIDRDFLSAAVNLGSLHFLNRSYEEALTVFTNAFETLRKAGRENGRTGAKILLNISKSCYALEKFEESKEYFEYARELEPALAEEHSYLSRVSEGGTARAADTEEKGIVFIE